MGKHGGLSVGESLGGGPSRNHIAPFLEAVGTAGFVESAKRKPDIVGVAVHAVAFQEASETASSDRRVELPHAREHELVESGGDSAVHGGLF